ncbi:hypothetical protein A3K29_02375 [Candidatus Collierbacteria bacterium RIFOXYB2_FULL_46_14]|uniref:TPR domain protein n=1 Tax=Candidatus Collierbacteria bacterium GW2011_GWA2_46_26 TaxID=1618381 RepID=A0A0G1PIG1_9BACT|nr:MAG: TPR domain protein [Candidatus Collierbacteria bacterium GW2011_GWA2_46_26]OGD72969.1 MAG: hypothetical protein A3K29_02375 [Candidatus Collierbacteria bacterium RIFOXYB2_FULL_46_14]OGD76011.1 MAG: hypothetical protein A3K43_02375 [Candidatus Collierbacteria bacterium RIFOXYA2_FULL_46_20]OGD77347.1 MAG: hypothetical protein A3K39_02375 [Candidatus Collierbacteria bacterium RIFOXYC2_FULL_43_15]OGD80637.1 MAG: hypothetical protein A2320_02870 [Pseudomonadales bacterium GWC2_63_15]OGD8206
MNKHKLDEKSIAEPKATTAAKFEAPILWGLLTVALLIWLTSLPNKFVSDDIPTILDNAKVGIWSFDLFRPWWSFQYLIYAVLTNIFGVVPWPLRLTGILFHLTTSFVLFKIVRRWYDFPVAIIAVALFVLAPTVVEPVVWISGMPYVLGGMLTMLCMYLHWDEKQTKLKHAAEVALWILTLVSCEKYIFVPVLLFIWDWRNKRLRKMSMALTGLFLMSFLRGLALISVYGERAAVLTNSYYTVAGEIIENPIAKVLVPTGNYIWLYFWPKALTLYHSEVDLSWKFIFSFGGISLLFLLWAWIDNKKIKNFWLWPALFMTSLLVTLTPTGMNMMVAERYAYFGYACLAVMISLSTTYISEKKKQWIVLYCLVTVWVLLMAGRTLLRIRDWRTADALWFSAEEYSPNSPINHNNLGDAYVNLRNAEKAIEEFTRAIELNPNYADAMHNRASTYMFFGEREKAREGFEEALKINPNLWMSYLKLAFLDESYDDWDMAIVHASKALEIVDIPDIRRYIELLKQKAEQKQKNP